MPRTRSHCRRRRSVARPPEVRPVNARNGLAYGKTEQNRVEVGRESGANDSSQNSTPAPMQNRATKT